MQATVQRDAVQSDRQPVLKPSTRNSAVDAYRGLVMVLMMAEVLQLARVAHAYPRSGLLYILAYNQTHVDWAGCSLHDLIQPSFSFLVGVVLPYSIASRLARGAMLGRMFAHALWRSLVLVALGIFLRSIHSDHTNFTFEDTLTQIGLGYPFLFLLGFRSRRWQWISLAAILIGYWLAWAVYPAPGPDFDYSRVGVPANWTHNYTGFAAHWNKNANLGAAFDYWFLNLFPRRTPFVANSGGYLTLSFIPTLGTMILGLIAGRWLREDVSRVPYRKFVIAGIAGVLVGLALHFTGVCPVVKRIWTPSWTLFSGGACFLLLAGFCRIAAMKGAANLEFPLVVVGMNSIAAYVMAHLFGDFIANSFRIHLGANIFRIFGAGFEPLVLGSAVLLTYWLLLFWMYQRKIFLRI